jgi:hypothetical protein
MSQPTRPLIEVLAEIVRGKNMLHKEPTGCLTTKRLMRVR